jgi:hypothetical protein
MDLPALALVLNLAATWYMTGLIWFVQLVHYAQFPLVGEPGFAAYHRRHTRFTTLAVGPAMLVEAATAAALIAWRPPAVAAWVAWVGVALVGGLWASTALVQVPRHDVLARGFDPAACRSLTRTNWARTAGWTARAVLMAWATAAAVR